MKRIREDVPEYRSLTSDVATVLAPTAAVVAHHLLSKGSKAKDEPPPQAKE